MLTIKNSAGNNLVFFLMLATLFAGCMPPGPRALLDGKELVENGHYPEAVEKLKVATSLIRTNAIAWNYLGLAYHHTGQITNAMEAYQRALTLDHDLTEAHYNLGCLWLEQNRPDLAKAELTAYTLRRGNSTNGWLKLATAQSRLRDWAAAESSFKEALRVSPQQVEALNGLGVIQFQRNRPREAVPYFDSALEQQPDYPPALLNRAIVSHRYLNNRPLALQGYRQYLALPTRPANWEEVNTAARALEQELNADVRPAAASTARSPNASVAKVASNTVAHASNVPRSSPLTNAVKTPPVSPSSISSLDLVKLPPEPVVKSAPDVSLAFAPATNARTGYAEGSTPPGARVESPKMERQGGPHPMNPLKLFRRETEVASRATPLPSDGGPALPEEAGAMADPARASAGMPIQPAASNRTFRYNYRNPAKPVTGNHAAAERAFAQGAQAQGANHLPEAIQAYWQATQLDPGYYDAYYNLGLAATSAGNVQQALIAYEMALAVRPESLDARYNFALVLKQASCMTDAANELEKVLAVYPNEGRAHLALGNLYAQQLSQPAKARAHYLKVLEADPRNPQAPAIRYWLTANRP